MNKKKKSKTKIVVWSVVIVLIIGIVGIRYFRPKNAEYTEATASTGDITTYYSFTGSVAAKNSQMLYADKAMQIKDIAAAKDQEVKSGDVLMTTESGQDITAPFDGTVSEIDSEVGAQLIPGAKLCKVVDYGNLELQVQVDEYDINAVTVGKSADVMINALNKTITGTISEVAKEGIYQNGVTYFNAAISLPADSALMVGMSAQASVLNQSVSGVTTLPMTAVQFDQDNNPYVYMRDGKLIKKVDIELGINDGINVQVINGLNSGDTVLVPPPGTELAIGGRGFFGFMRGGRSNGSSSNETGNTGTISNSTDSGSGGSGK